MARRDLLKSYNEKPISNESDNTQEEKDKKDDGFFSFVFNNIKNIVNSNEDVLVNRLNEKIKRKR